MTPDDNVGSPLEEEAVALLKRRGLHVLEPFTTNAPVESRSRIGILAKPRITDFYPKNYCAQAAMDHAAKFAPHALLIPWSEAATAMFADMNCRKYAYYGNPDHKSFLASAQYNWENGGALKTYLLARYRGRQLKKLHLATLAKYSNVGDVADNDAKFYRSNGLKNVEYIQNIWVDRFRDKPPALSSDAADASKHINVIANIGILEGTANRYGLAYLAEQVVPRLGNLMPNKSWTAHILGSGRLSPKTAKTLSYSPNVMVRGFVDDIDREMSESGIFVCVNNGTRYNVGHTRYLHAWSLGCCVIAHTAVREAMPELVHDQNALLGNSGEEIAILIARAAADRKLRQRIGAEGYQTFRQHFTADRVVPKILSALSL